MLEVKHLYYRIKSKDKGKQRAKEAAFELQDISFTLEKGYIMTLLGCNGSGKSTLLNLIMGNTASDSGSITFYGNEVSVNRNHVLQKIGFISDRMEFLKYRTLLENVGLFGRLYNDFRIEQWEMYMQSFGFEKGELEHLYNDLSLGEKRKFQLAFALSYKPELLLLDEPTANLDPRTRVEWMEVIGQQVTENKMSVIMATHLTSDLDQVTDYILVLDKGKQLAFMDREEMIDIYGEIALSELLQKLTEE